MEPARRSRLSVLDRLAARLVSHQLVNREHGAFLNANDAGIGLLGRSGSATTTNGIGDGAVVNVIQTTAIVVDLGPRLKLGTAAQLNINLGLFGGLDHAAGPENVAHLERLPCPVVGGIAGATFHPQHAGGLVNWRRHGLYGQPNEGERNQAGNQPLCQTLNGLHMYRDSPAQILLPTTSGLRLRQQSVKLFVAEFLTAQIEAENCPNPGHTMAPSTPTARSPKSGLAAFARLSRTPLAVPQRSHGSIVVASSIRRSTIGT